VSERNKAASRAVFEIWMTGELDRLGEFVADDVVHHDPYDPHGAEGIEGHRKTIALNRRAFHNIEVTIEDQISEADRLATRGIAAMTHPGELVGTSDSGKRVRISGITVERFEDGKVVEAWRCMDTLGLMQQIGTVS
jgi:predicted ester cyclase